MMKYFVALIICLFITVSAQASEVEEVTSPYGFKAWVIQDHSLPIVSLNMAFKKSGFAYDPKDKGGLAYMVRSLLDEGAGDMDGITFKQKLESHAIHLSFDVDEDNFYVNLKTLKENLPLALSLCKLALTSPRFDEDAIERVRNQIRTYIDSRKEDPATLADEAFRKEIFGDHPYGKVKVGTKESLASINKDDLQKFTKQHFTRVQVVISMVGDVQPKEVSNVLDQYFIDLPLATDSDATLEEFTKFPAGKEKTIIMDVPQSTVIFGSEGVKRSDPDFYPALVLNYILGGGSFTSRLMDEVREKKGLAYTVGTSLEILENIGLLKGYVATKNAKIHESMAIIREVFQNLHDNGVTQEEVDNAKSYLIGSFPLNLDKNEKLAAYLIGMQLEDLGKDFLDKRNEYIQKVTLEDVNRVAKKIVVPDNLITVIVGNPKEARVQYGEKTDAVVSAGY